MRGRLVSAGLRAFVAERDLRAQIGSSEWNAAVHRVLGRSRLLVALVTESAQKSKWVAEECSEFHAHVQDRGRGILIPVCFPPLTPADLGEPLTRYDAVKVPDGWNENVVGEVIDRIRNALGA